MNNIFRIRVNNEPAEVEKVDHNTFTVHTGSRDIRVQYREDNEGAAHWIDLNTYHETEEAKLIGEQLEQLEKEL